MNPELPWTSVGVATGYRGNPYRGNPRISTASATAYETSTANATAVVATARAAVLPVANSVYQPWQPSEVRGKFHDTFRGNCRGIFHNHPRPLPWQRGNHHGNPRKSAAIATAVSVDVQPQEIPRPSLCRSRPLPRQPSDGDTHHYLAFPTIAPQ